MIEAVTADNGVPCFLHREKLSHEKLSRDILVLTKVCTAWVLSSSTSCG